LNIEVSSSLTKHWFQAGGGRIDKEEYGGVNYVLKETGQLALRNIETVLCTSLIWSILLIPGLLAFPMPLSGLYAAFVGPLGLVMVLRFTFLAVRHKRNKWAFFRRGLPRLLLSGSVVGVMYAAAFIVVYSAWWYYDRVSASISHINPANIPHDDGGYGINLCITTSCPDPAIRR